MICFGFNDPEYKQCDTFDEISVGSLPNSSKRHHWGCLAYYNGNPTVVGGHYNYYDSSGNFYGWPIKATETLVNGIWQPGIDFSR